MCRVNTLRMAGRVANIIVASWLCNLFQVLLDLPRSWYVSHGYHAKGWTEGKTDENFTSERVWTVTQKHVRGTFDLKARQGHISGHSVQFSKIGL